MDLRDIVELVNLVAGLDIAELEVEHEGFRIRIVRGGARAVLAPSGEAAPAPVSVQRVAEAVTGSAAAEAPGTPEEAGLYLMKSPIVGTFYRSASPAAEPYVKPGDRVKKGQVICIVEAMKLMNEIESEVSGMVVDVVVEDGQPVEYGEPLFKIRPDK